MIDIHCHLLYGVDDGSGSRDESVMMLKRAKEQGISRIVLTPHYRHGMFPYGLEDIERNYESLKPVARELGIELYLGTEYHVNSQIVEAFRTGRCHSIGDGKYILTEYSHDTEYSYIRKMTQEVIFAGYIPIIVHVERYMCLVEDIENIEELRRMGALIQNNADAVLGLEGRRPKKFCKKLLKAELTDIIASDSHGINSRACNMQKCFDYISRKFGVDYAQDLFQNNPQRIIDSIN